jgi:hypothetical protein
MTQNIAHSGPQLPHSPVVSPPAPGYASSAMSTQDKTDLSLALAAFAATATLLGPIAAAIAAAFIFGLLIGQGRTQR